MRFRFSSALIGALAIAGHWDDARATALADAAAQLEPGQWAVLQTQNFNSSLLDDGASYDVFYYSEDMTWDPVSRQLLFVGGGHASDAEFLRYSEATNTWQRTKPAGSFWHSNFSHAYDHNAIIPSLGKFFFRQPAYDPSNRIEIYDIPSGTWSRSAAMPTRPGCCGGLEYFPELGGLVLVNGDQGVLLYEVEANSWRTLSNAAWGDYHNFAEYSPVHKVLIFGGGETSGGTAIFRLNAQGQITRLGNAPQRMGTTHSIVTTDPNSGNFLVIFNSAWYELNPVTDTWQRLPGTPPWSGGVFGTVATPISTYGVVLFAHYTGPSDARVYLYKHSPGSGTTVPQVTLSANPLSVASLGTTTLTWTSTDASSCSASGGWSGAKATSGTEVSGALSANTTFTLTCSNASGGSTSRSVTVTVAAAIPPPTVNFSASPGSVAVGGSSTLNWTTSNASSCTGSGGLAGWAGGKSVPNGSQNVGPIDAATTFTLSCTGAGGTTARSVTITLAPAPSLSFSANPTTVAAGGQTTLSWSAQNAASCAASGAWAGAKATSGSEPSPLINADASFNLECTGNGGTVGRTVTVSVSQSPAPTVTLSASPASVSVNGASTLTWSATNATACTASNGWSGAKPTSGSEGTGALSTTRTFALSCSGPGGSASASATVAVSAGGSGESTSGGGGRLDLALLLLGAGLLALRGRLGRARGSVERRRGTAPGVAKRCAQALLLTALGAGAAAADLTTVTIASGSSSAQSNVPVTFGQVFKRGDVPASAVLGARLGGSGIALQVDKKATHADGSLRHAVLTAIVPSLAANGAQTLTLTDSGTAPGGGAIAASSLLATSFDVSINLDIGGTLYSASARSLLQSGTPPTWLAGPLATEWLLSGPVRTQAGAAHPHLQARFHVRAYQGLQAVRVEAVLENTWAYEAGPRNYTYNVTIDVAGRGTAYSQSNVNHYRQSRWRRVVWWGTAPAVGVRHDGAYLQATRAVPSYDPRVTISSAALNSWVSGLGSNPGVMSIGALEPNMPSPGGRFEIAPLPAFQAGYIISQDDRARRVTIGYGEQAGAWPMHYRDKDTDQPISIDTYPNATILGASGVFGNFPACGGSCSTSPLLPEASHHPSLAYLPYLITGDYYLMEETVFWGNWVLFYGEAGRRGGSQGLVVWDQVRGQAWALRTLGQAAYATPDDHPLKQYLVQKLQNNISYYRNNWVDSNPLGYITNTGAAAWLGLDDWIASWMDDFLTWTFGHLVGLGFSDAQPVLAWKAKFPVGRLTHPDMCWILASSYWPYVRGDRYAGGTSAFVTTWLQWRRNLVFGWNNDAFRGTRSIAGQEQALFDAQCNSSQMASILGLRQGEMIGWDGAEAYAADLQAATAVAVEAGVPNAQQAFDVLTSRPTYPLSAYGSTPQWAVYPATATASLPAVQISASPTAVTSGQTSTLTWSASNASSCTASGGWAGNKALSGTEVTAAITATTTYVLTCTNAAGSSSASTTVTLQSPPAPTLTLSANPTTVASGGSTTLTWSSTNASSCTASGAWSGSKAVSGTQTIGNLTSTGTFTLVCAGAGGSSPTRSVTVTVSATPPPAPTVDLTATPTTVAANGTAILEWSSTNASSCSASGGWSGAKSTQGSETSPAISAAVTFTLTCTGAGGSASDSVSVDVTAGAGGGGGGGGGSGDSSGGGGPVEWLSLALLALLLSARRAPHRAARARLRIPAR